MKKIHWITLFSFFLLCLLFIFTLFRGDTFVNYGFSYAIRLGEVPYKDFNMVITPLAPFLYSIGLFIYNDLLTIYIEQALLLTVLFYILYQLLGKKSILLLLLFIIPYPIAMVSTIFPGYNFLLYFLLISFIYIYKYSYNYYLYGILLGLIFCTKQTVGIVLLIPTLYYLFTDRKRFFKTLIGYMIPCLLLFLYLIITNSLSEFINLCFLGLFDFQKSNQHIDWFYFILLLIGIGYFIYRIIHDKKNLLLYYGLLFSIVSIPIIDYYHVSLFYLIVLYFLVDSIQISKKYYSIIYIFIPFICILWSFVSYCYMKNPVIYSMNHFHYILVFKDYKKYSKELMTKVSSKKVIYLMKGSENYYYKILHNQRIDYLDLPNYGNYGYHGVDKMIEKIQSLHDYYFVLDRVLMKDNSPFQQYIKELGNMVIQNSVLVDSVGVYDIYYKE